MSGLSLGLGLGLSRRAGRPFSLADQLLAGESAGFALSGIDMSAVVRGHTTNFRGNANDLLAYTDPDTKYVRNSAGILVPGTTLRVDHDGAGAPLGLLVEPQATNLWRPDISTRSLYTEANEVSGWPLGLFTGNGSSGTSWSDGNDRFSDSDIVVGSIVAMRGTARYIMLGFTGFTTFTSNNAAFDFDTGDFTFNGTQISPFAEDLGGGLWRLWVRNNNPIDTASLRGLRIRPSDGTDNQTVILGDGATMIWGAAQLEVASEPSSYIPTAGSEVTRAADDITIPLADFPWNGGSGTLTLNGSAVTPVTAGSDLDIAGICFAEGVTHLESLVWIPS